MFILGLGSNLGDRLHHLREAHQSLNQHPAITVKAVSPIYQSAAMLPAEGAPSHWQQPFLNAAVLCQTSLKPLELLHAVKQIENDLGRNSGYEKWSPRVIDIDLLIGEEALKTNELTLPHPGLFERPFALWPVSDLAPLWQLETVHFRSQAWGSRFTGKAPYGTRQTNLRLTGARLVGILNITPNSFSDGLGELTHECYETLLKRAQTLVAAGAEVLDIGAESTAPAAKPISADEEWERLEPFLALLQNNIHASIPSFIQPPLLSIDTYHAATARKALAYGINWINDVSGFRDSEMQMLLQTHPAVRGVTMHHVTIPAARDQFLDLTKNPVNTVYEWGAKRIQQLLKIGIQQQQIIFDPGIGFGKVPAQSIALLKAVSQFQLLGVDILYGHSRKRFLDWFVNKAFDERDIETALIAGHLSQLGVQYLRLHDVEKATNILKIQNALEQ